MSRFQKSMGVRRNFSRGETSTFCLSFVVDDTIKMDVHKTLYPFHTTLHHKENALCHGNSHKNCSSLATARSNASFSLMLLFTQYKITWLTVTSSHCLAALSAKMSAFTYRVARFKANLKKNRPKTVNKVAEKNKHSGENGQKKPNFSFDKAKFFTNLRPINSNSHKNAFCVPSASSQNNVQNKSLMTEKCQLFSFLKTPK